SRLAAIIQRVRSGQPANDLASLRALADGANLGNCQHDAAGHTVSCSADTVVGYVDNAGFLGYAVPAFLYQVYMGLGDVVTANTYADLVIDKGILSDYSCWNVDTCDIGTDAAALPAEGAAVAADWVWARIEARGLRSQVIASLNK